MLPFRFLLLIPWWIKIKLSISILSQYHGGTNFGRTAGGPYITTSYDYDAPLDEYGGSISHKIYLAIYFIYIWYDEHCTNFAILFWSFKSPAFWSLGNLRQPKYGHLKELHSVLMSMEKILLHGDYIDTNYGDNVTVRSISCHSFVLEMLSNFVSRVLNLCACRASNVTQHILYIVEVEVKFHQV